jgi:plastocyanin
MPRTVIVVLTLAALLGMTMPVLAGGYAVVRLDEKPDEVFVEKPWTFGFMVLQHDVSPNSDVTPVLRAQHKETGETITATGVQLGEVGHFVAVVTFPRAGEWKWAIEPQPFAETSFETLNVLDETDALTTSPESHAAAAEQDDAAMTIEILEDWIFEPASLETAPGTTVRWLNRSSIAHTVTVDDLAFNDSGLIEPGESFSLTFAEAGTYEYRCSPHPGMEGTIVVA